MRLTLICRWEDVGPVYLEAMDALHQVRASLNSRLPPLLYHGRVAHWAFVLSADT